MKILLAVDGSDYTKQMLSYLASHQELLGPAGDYTVLTVVPPVPPRVNSFIDRQTLDGYYEEQAQAVLQPVQAFAATQNWKPAFTHAVGHAADVIADTAASGNFDLIVMGSHGHSSIGSLVLGSVTAKVLSKCKTPLLIVR